MIVAVDELFDFEIDSPKTESPSSQTWRTPACPW